MKETDADGPQAPGRAGPDMTPEERAELERLYEEFRRGLAEDGGVWPVYAGDGE